MVYFLCGGSSCVISVALRRPQACATLCLAVLILVQRGGPVGARGASPLAGMPRFPCFGNQRANVGLWSHPDMQSGHSWDILWGPTV